MYNLLSFFDVLNFVDNCVQAILGGSVQVPTLTGDVLLKVMLVLILRFDSFLLRQMNRC